MINFEDLCRHRRSIRKYLDKPVEQEKIDYMLRCALMSPSGKRLNPWEFYVLTDREALLKLKDCKTYGSGMFETARAGIVVAVDASKTDTWQCDGAIAAHNMLLAAEDCGLGACWCHIYGRAESERLVREIAGVRDELSILCVISLGYKDEERKLYDIEKLPYEKIHKL